MKKRYSATFIMMAVIALVSITVLCSCGTRKSTSQNEQKTTTRSDSSGASEKTKNASTLHYGDSLKGSAIVNENSNPTKPATTTTSLESKGLKVKVNTTPVYDASGKRTGTKIDIEGIAKPTAITNASESEKSSAQVSKTSKQKSESTTDTEVTTTNWWAVIKWFSIFLGALVLYVFRKYLRSLLFN